MITPGGEARQEFIFDKDGLGPGDLCVQDGYEQPYSDRDQKPYHRVPGIGYPVQVEVLSVRV